MLMVLKIIASEVKLLISANYENSACDWPSTCYKAALTFPIALRDIENNLICLILI